MPHKQRSFIEGEYYHIIAKRIEDKLMFEDNSDYYRGTFSLREFNDVDSVRMQKRLKPQREKNNGRGRPPTKNKEGEKEEPVGEKEEPVDVVAFCLMPNHVHLLLTPIIEGGITQFMSKFMSGYASYYKTRHEIQTKGHFYQDRFNAVHIENDSQLRAVFVYIHTNPVSLIYPGWKEGAEIDAQKALEYCINYKWSSLMDYLGIKKFPSVTQREFMNEFIGGAKGCRKEIKEWLEHKEEMFEKYSHFLIE